MAAVEKLAEPFLEADGYELVEVQYRREPRGWVLRLFMDRAPNGPSPGMQGGITLDDCVAISRELGHLLEVEEVVPGPYHLEIPHPASTVRSRSRRISFALPAARSRCGSRTRSTVSGISRDA